MDVATQFANAKRAFDQVDAQLSQYATVYGAVAATLAAKRGKMIFSNTGTGLPAEASMARDSTSINANDVPTPSKIQEALAEWHNAKRALENAWDALPQEFRSSMTIPPVIAASRHR